jgi:hypothetical protein
MPQAVCGVLFQNALIWDSLGAVHVSRPLPTSCSDPGAVSGLAELAWPVPASLVG